MNRRSFLVGVGSLGLLATVPAKAVAKAVSLVTRPFRRVITWKPGVPWHRRLLWWKKPEDTYYKFGAAIDACHRLSEDRVKYLRIDSGGERARISPGTYDCSGVTLGCGPDKAQIEIAEGVSLTNLRAIEGGSDFAWLDSEGAEE